MSRAKFFKIKTAIQRKSLSLTCTQWGFEHHKENHGNKEYARDDDGDGFCEVHVNTMEGFWSLLRS